MLIVAASARPWIESAEMAGFCVTAFDFFNDWDSSEQKSQRQINSQPIPDVALSRIVCRLERFNDLTKQGNLELISKCDYAILAGGLENHPSLIQALSSLVKILGPDALQHERLSDSVEILARLGKKGFQVPESSYRLGSMIRPGEWLKKSFQSSGGLGIQHATEGDVGLESTTHYYQKKVAGEDFSGVFVSVRQETGRSKTALLGWTRQLIGGQWCAAGEFRYCGSIGPLALDPYLQTKVEEIGRSVGEEYGIIGVWGIDFLVDGKDVIPVDFNIRLTASMEIFDFEKEKSESPSQGMIELHFLACQGHLDVDQIRSPAELAGAERESRFGKTILFYDGVVPVQVTSNAHQNLVSQWSRLGELVLGGFGVADIPRLGDWIKPGQPVCTILVKDEPGKVIESLKIASLKIRRSFVQAATAQ